jgi:hypothetical protein
METLEYYRKERNEEFYEKNLFEQTEYCKKYLAEHKIQAVAYFRVWNKEQLND